MKSHVALLYSFVLTLCIYVPTILTTKNHAITTLINTKWNQTPLYVEIAEYMTDENTDLFWEFINSLETIERPLSEYDTDSQQYLAAINVARSHLSELQMLLLKLVVSMHTSTPRIQAHLQSANQLNPNQDCAKVFAYIDSSLVCTLDELKSKLSDIESIDQKEIVELYNFDHIYPNTENNSRTVILFGDIGTNEFIKFHRYLSRQSIENNIRYVFRHYFRSSSSQRVRLSSYGVELHLKSTEYKSQDDAPKQAEENESDDSTEDSSINGFDFKILQARFPTLSYSLNQFKRSLVHTNDEIPQLKPWEFQDLGLKAAAAITEAPGEKSLQILQYISQNFPMQSRTFVGKNVPEPLRMEIKSNIELFGRTLNIAPPDGALFVNGFFFDADTMDLGTILETIRIELRVLENLHANGFHGNIATSLLGIDLSTTSNAEFAIDIRDPAFFWINDIETDVQYRRWPSSVTDLLRPTFPGMLRNIRKNLFNLILVIDPLNLKCRNLIKLAESFVEHLAPIRLGLVFDASEASESNLSEYRAIICAFNYVSEKIDSRSALGFLKDVLAAMAPNEQVLLKHVQNQLKKKFPKLSKSDINSIISIDSEYDSKTQLAQDFINRLGLGSSPHALINGVPIEQKLLCSDNDFEEAVFSEVMQQTSTLQKAVYKGELTENDDVVDFLMNQPNIMPRLNLRILNESNVNFLDFSGTPHTNIDNVQELAKKSNRDMTATLLMHVKYFQIENSAEKIANSKVHFLTVWVIADLDTFEGRELLKNALMYVKLRSSVRVAFIPNTEGSKVNEPSNMNRIVWALSQAQIDSIATIEIVLDLLNDEKTIGNTIEQIKEIIPLTELHMKMLRVYAQRVLSLGKSERLVVGNGKIYGPFLKKEKFTVDDFKLMEHFNTQKYGEKIRNFFKQFPNNNDNNLNSDTLLKLYVNLISRQTKARFKIPNDVSDMHSVLKLQPKDESLPFFDITAIVDPASRGAQKLAPILILFRNILNCQMRVYLTPTGQHSDMPIKNFYRYVIEPEVNFDSHGKLSETKKVAKFTSLPVNSLLTQNLHIPDNWLVEVVRSVYDLDNIKLDEIGGSVHSEYELEFLLIEGHCFDATNGAPPRGLQMILGQKVNSNIVDTIVMANLGYFQLKANPGAWELRLREGKSSYIYDITNAEGPNTIFINNTARIVVSSLRPYVIKLRVQKKPDKQDEDLLDDNDVRSQSSGIWNSIANSFSGSNSDLNENEDDVINIFSVASGHLYERLLRIMMLSLLKHTKSPVKFWFLKNYLSPQFTDFLPHMAREYNFEFELVQYKWPRWLHQQTEKQRTIWGYKILFLDVLFPLNVRKIIFVDADAIVRTDIKELYELDLGNSPYAYTPFCDSRKEMEGFRFWKQGYWRSHLMGRRYHISALYVVDLKRFRKVAAGDRLRGQYQALSQDPNSLSNLDQDLPNNMIHQVSIKSLPDEWLWCETWCSDSSFKNAKVIDLCNNPQTKEAKLAAAQRIVPEWKSYDEEIKRLMAKITDNENLDSESTESVDFPPPPKPEEKRTRDKEHIEL